MLLSSLNDDTLIFFFCVTRFRRNGFGYYLRWMEMEILSADTCLYIVHGRRGDSGACCM